MTISNREVAIRSTFQRFMDSERQRCLEAINGVLLSEGWADLTAGEVDAVLLARATGTLPGDGMPGPDDQDDDDCSDILAGHGVCERCEG